MNNFDEEKLLDNYSKFEFRDLQGSHWAPHIIHKEIWDKVSGFSEEFNPGFASDPDLNMKLWNIGVRIFKGVSLSLFKAAMIEFCSDCLRFEDPNLTAGDFPVISGCRIC